MSNTKQVRTAIVQYVAEHTKYDAETVRITSTGEVSAILDANKTYSGPHTTRLVVGCVEDLLRAAAYA